MTVKTAKVKKKVKPFAGSKELIKAKKTRKQLLDEAASYSKVTPKRKKKAITA